MWRSLSCKQRFPNSRHLQQRGSTADSALSSHRGVQVLAFICHPHLGKPVGPKHVEAAGDFLVLHWKRTQRSRGRGQSESNCGVGQWLCVSLPVSVAGAKPGATFPWGSHVSPNAVRTCLSLPSLARKESCLVICVMEKSPGSFICRQPSPGGFRGWEFSTSHEVAPGNAWPKMASLHFMAKLDQEYAMCVTKRVIKFCIQIKDK